ncbi:hypothetical protein L596_020941 [Steinernema carpocapsae]|uniref:Uncharacterized protein n=1 Tax=Steinernema carpocapsae TaxID=34508 RepID=A0A4U5MV05_STECR|nr:hypothetical protein L596_020941 [Steinernema carpocapsae]
MTSPAKVRSMSEDSCEADYYHQVFKNCKGKYYTCTTSYFVCDGKQMVSFEYCFNSWQFPLLFNFLAFDLAPGDAFNFRRLMATIFTSFRSKFGFDDPSKVSRLCARFTTLRNSLYTAEDISRAFRYFDFHFWDDFVANRTSKHIDLTHRVGLHLNKVLADGCFMESGSYVRLFSALRDHRNEALAGDSGYQALRITDDFDVTRNLACRREAETDESQRTDRDRPEQPQSERVKSLMAKGENVALLLSEDEDQCVEESSKAKMPSREAFGNADVDLSKTHFRLPLTKRSRWNQPRHGPEGEGRKGEATRHKIAPRDAEL